MTESQRKRQSIPKLKKSLERLEKLLRSPYARPADVAARDRIARRLQEASTIRRAG